MKAVSRSDRCAASIKAYRGLTDAITGENDDLEAIRTGRPPIGGSQLTV
jgi:hypothetical protein